MGQCVSSQKEHHRVKSSRHLRHQSLQKDFALVTPPHKQRSARLNSLAAQLVHPDNQSVKPLGKKALISSVSSSIVEAQPADSSVSSCLSTTLPRGQTAAVDGWAHVAELADELDAVKRRLAEEEEEADRLREEVDALKRSGLEISTPEQLRKVPAQQKDELEPAQQKDKLEPAKVPARDNGGSGGQLGEREACKDPSLKMPQTSRVLQEVVLAGSKENGRNHDSKTEGGGGNKRTWTGEDGRMVSKKDIKVPLSGRLENKEEVSFEQWMESRKEESFETPDKSKSRFHPSADPPRYGQSSFAAASDSVSLDCIEEMETAQAPVIASGNPGVSLFDRARYVASSQEQGKSGGSTPPIGSPAETTMDSSRVWSPVKISWSESPEGKADEPSFEPLLTQDSELDIFDWDLPRGRKPLAESHEAVAHLHKAMVSDLKRTAGFGLDESVDMDMTKRIPRFALGNLTMSMRESVASVGGLNASQEYKQEEEVLDAGCNAAPNLKSRGRLNEEGVDCKTPTGEELSNSFSFSSRRSVDEPFCVLLPSDSDMRQSDDSVTTASTQSGMSSLYSLPSSISTIESRSDGSLEGPSISHVTPLPTAPTQPFPVLQHQTTTVALVRSASDASSLSPFSGITSSTNAAPSALKPSLLRKPSPSRSTQQNTKPDSFNNETHGPLGSTSPRPSQRPAFSVNAHGLRAMHSPWMGSPSPPSKHNGPSRPNPSLSLRKDETRALSPQNSYRNAQLLPAGLEMPSATSMRRSFSAASAKCVVVGLPEVSPVQRRTEKENRARDFDSAKRPFASPPADTSGLTVVVGTRAGHPPRKAAAGPPPRKDGLVVLTGKPRVLNSSSMGRARGAGEMRLNRNSHFSNSLPVVREEQEPVQPKVMSGKEGYRRQLEQRLNMMGEGERGLRAGLSNSNGDAVGGRNVQSSGAGSASARSQGENGARNLEETETVGDNGCSDVEDVEESRGLSLLADGRGVPNTTSKYREDRQVRWTNTPFEVRLERSLSRQMNAPRRHLRFEEVEASVE